MKKKNIKIYLINGQNLRKKAPPTVNVYSRRSPVYNRRSSVYSRRSRVNSRRSRVYSRRSICTVGGAPKQGRGTP